jgi:uncharacterized protein YndB with AHSA1/START domain
VIRPTAGYLLTMSVTSRVVDASAEEVWHVLADGWLYPLWVVGASRMREVDDHWPAVGARLHHSVGVWPLLIDDSTEVKEAAPGERLVLRARGWPAGEAQVVLRLSPQGERTEVVIEESVVAGPGALMPRFVQDPLLSWRNVETLRRLAHVVEGRAAQGRA